MGYCVAGQVSTMMSIVMYKINFRLGYMILSRFFVILCEMFLRAHMSNNSIISLIVSAVCIFDGLGGAL